MENNFIKVFSHIFLGQEKCSYKCLLVAALKTEIHSQKVEWLLHISNRWFQGEFDFSLGSQRKSEWGIIHTLALCLAFLPYCQLLEKTMLLYWAITFVISLQHLFVQEEWSNSKSYTRSNSKSYTKSWCCYLEISEFHQKSSCSMTGVWVRFFSIS